MKFGNTPHQKKAKMSSWHKYCFFKKNAPNSIFLQSDESYDSVRERHGFVRYFGCVGNGTDLASD
jgi:hypothetical protein